MSLLGIDVGTTGCKAIVFRDTGEMLSRAYAEYDIVTPHPHEAELDARSVWGQIKSTIRSAVARSSDPVDALAVTSMGEAMVPVSADRHILGPSILNVDIRGNEFVAELQSRIDGPEFYRLNGNTIGNQYGLPKLMWLKKHAPELYEKTAYFLHWSSFVAFLLGAPPVVDYSLANRTLLFDLSHQTWSRKLLELGGIDPSRLPSPVQAGTEVGTVSRSVAAELGLSPATRIVVGAHDQCASAVGAGAIEAGTAMYGMGTFPCIMPVFAELRAPAAMIELGLNTEHHAAPGLFGSFIYHMGGAATKWFRDQLTEGRGMSSESDRLRVYETLFREMPDQPSGVLVLPHFAPMGPPDYIADSGGVILGLTTETDRGAILRGIAEGNVFAHRLVVDRLPEVDIDISVLRAVGGGSRSEKTLALTADILNRPILRPKVEEAGALGAALLAGTGIRTYSSLGDAVSTAVRVEKTVEPNARNVGRYNDIFELYKELRESILPLTQKWTRIRDSF